MLNVFPIYTERRLKTKEIYSQSLRVFMYKKLFVFQYKQSLSMLVFSISFKIFILLVLLNKKQMIRKQYCNKLQFCQYEYIIDSYAVCKSSDTTYGAFIHVDMFIVSIYFSILRMYTETLNHVSVKYRQSFISEHLKNAKVTTVKIILTFCISTSGKTHSIQQ